MYFLGFPLALWAFSSLPLLGGIYWLRNRYKQVTVSSLVLWDKHTLARSGGRKIQRIQTSLLFFIEMTILSLLAFAATAPMLPLSGSTRSLVIVLDDSWSMQAENQNYSCKQAAIDKIFEEFNAYGSTEATIIFAGKNVRQAATNINTSVRLKETLDKWSCRADRADLTQGITLACGIADKWTDILVITDHPADIELMPDSNIVWHSVGRKMPNIAIVNAFRSAADTDQKLVIEIANLSNQDAKTILALEAETGQEPALIKNIAVDLTANTTRRLSINLPDTNKAITARLTGTDDALDIDNDILLLAPDRDKLRVAIDLKGEELLKYIVPVVEASGFCEITNNSPELIITSKVNRIGDSGGPWRLCIKNESDAVSFSGPYVTDESSPVLEGVYLEGVIWGAARQYSQPQKTASNTTDTANNTDINNDDTTKTPPIPGRPLAMAGEIELLNIINRSDERFDLFMRWNPQCSTLQNSVNFPIMIANYLKLCLLDRPGPQKLNDTVGSIIAFHLPDKSNSISITSPAGETSNFDLLSYQSRTFSFDADQDGLYSFTVKLSDETEFTRQVSVNSFTRTESDLSLCKTETLGNWQEAGQTESVYRKSSWLFAFAAFGLLMLHSYLLIKSGGTA